MFLGNTYVKADTKELLAEAVGFLRAEIYSARLPSEGK
jgi:hypothetical protein